jgi:hypothetical protein
MKSCTCISTTSVIQSDDGCCDSPKLMRRNEYETAIATRLDKETIGTLCHKGQSSCLNAVSRESKIVASERQLRERLQNLQLRSVKILDDGIFS